MALAREKLAGAAAYLGFTKGFNEIFDGNAALITLAKSFVIGPGNRPNIHKQRVMRNGWQLAGRRCAGSRGLVFFGRGMTDPGRRKGVGHLCCLPIWEEMQVPACTGK